MINTSLRRHNVVKITLRGLDNIVYVTKVGQNGHNNRILTSDEISLNLDSLNSIEIEQSSIGKFEELNDTRDKNIRGIFQLLLRLGENRGRKWGR